MLRTEEVRWECFFVELGMAVLGIAGGNGRASAGNTSAGRGRNKSWNGARWESYTTGPRMACFRNGWREWRLIIEGTRLGIILCQRIRNIVGMSRCGNYIWHDWNGYLEWKQLVGMRGLR